MSKGKKLNRLYLCFALSVIIALGIILYQISNNEKRKVLIVQKSITESIDASNIDTISQEENSGVQLPVEVQESASSSININTATSEQLQVLKGIGPAKAQAIIDFRNSSGNFKEISDILRVSGIGDKTFETIKEYITVGKE